VVAAGMEDCWAEAHARAQKINTHTGRVSFTRNSYLKQNGWMGKRGKRRAPSWIALTSSHSARGVGRCK